ncbi:MAG: glycerophosphodiester phosphodiesterase family protein [Polyangiaceae bacterium]
MHLASSRIVSLLLVAATGVLAACGGSDGKAPGWPEGALDGQGDSRVSWRATERPWIIGHRGSGKQNGAQIFPENTIPALLQAIQVQGAIGVEFDVALTSDQQVVLMHDPHVDRTTECTGCISEMTLEEAQACRTRDAAEEIFVPSLADALAALAALPVRPLIMVDTKIGMDDCPIPADSAEEQETLLGRGVAEALVDAGVDDIAAVQAQGATLLAELRQVTPRPITLFAKGGMDEALGVAEQHGFAGVAVGLERLEEGGIERARDGGRLVDTFVVNAPVDLSFAVYYDVDVIETDDPTDLLESFRD